MRLGRGLDVPRYGGRGLWAILLLVGFSTGLGCAKRPPPPPFTAPDAQVSVRYLAGDPLGTSGSTTPVSEMPADALSARVTLVSLEQAPHSPDIQPLGSRAALVTASRGGAAVLADPKVTRGAGVVSPAQARRFTDALLAGKMGRIARIADRTLVLPAGATSEVALADPVSRPDPLTGRPAAPRLTIALFHPATGANQSPSVQISLIARRATDGNALEQETVLLDPIPIIRPAQFALLVPFTFSGNRSWGVAAILDVSPGSDEPGYQQAVNRSATEARSQSAALARFAPPSTLPSAGASELGGAIAILNDPDRRRQALTFLADQSDARICQDAALSADPTVLAALCKRVAPRAQSMEGDPRAVGWLLDRETLALLAELADAGTLPPELSAVLTVHAGEAGRHPANMQDVLKGATEERSLATRLTSENLLFLEDSSPASRVRAFEWLTARGKAPTGYDPLAPARQRREALDRALSPPTQPIVREAGHE